MISSPASAAELGPLERWRAELEAWALPAELLARAPESPYGWPAGVLRRWNERTDTKDPTHRAIDEHLPPGGSLLDVGAGTGRIALAYARRAHPVVAVEPDAGMAAALRESAALERAPITVVEDRWPRAADQAAPADVAVSANVVYDVADIAPFVQALDQAAPWVVVELTSRHPWADLAPFYTALHGIDRPTGPTVDLFRAVVGESIGIEPAVTEWERPPGLYFASWDEILAFHRKRLLVGPERDEELRALLEPEVRWVDGRAYVGGARRMATVVWKSVAIG